MVDILYVLRWGPHWILGFSLIYFLDPCKVYVKPMASVFYFNHSLTVKIIRVRRTQDHIYSRSEIYRHDFPEDRECLLWEIIERYFIQIFKYFNFILFLYFSPWTQWCSPNRKQYILSFETLAYSDMAERILCRSDRLIMKHIIFFVRFYLMLNSL